MVDFDDDTPKRIYHGDVMLKVEEFSEDGLTVTGHDIRTGEEHSISLATEDEVAKHFATAQNRQRTYAERLESASRRIKGRKSIDIEGSIEVGSVLLLEGARTFQTPDGPKTAAMWPTGVARNPLDEAPILAHVQASHRFTKPDDNGKGGGRLMIDLSALQADKAAPLEDFDLKSAFTGEMDGLLMNQTGVVVTLRNKYNSMTVSTLETPFRTAAEPSIEAALDRPHGYHAAFAAAVVAASSGLREFEDLEFTKRVSPKKRESAKEIFDLVKSGGAGDLEVTAMPVAKTQLIPKHSTEQFLSSYFGTADGKPNDNVTPDPKKSYLDKGYFPSVLAMSRHNKEPDREPASARFVQPENKFQFAEVTSPLTVKDIGREVMVRLMGEQFGANTPGGASPTPEERPQESKRSRGYDSAPM